MENVNKFLNFVKTLPVAGKVLTLIIIILISVILFFFTSCGTMTSATIRNIQPNTSTSISIQNNNSMDTDVNTTANPSVSFNSTDDEKTSLP